MEFTRMYIGAAIFLFGAAAVFCYEDQHEMKQMLEKLVEQNKKLEEKFATITTGLTDMCRAVNLATCDCQDMDKAGSGKVTMKSNYDVRLMSIVSEGEVDDSIRLTITFEASDGYGLEWSQMFIHGNGFVRSPGKMIKTKLLNDRYLYTSDFQAVDYNMTTGLFIRLHSLLNSAEIGLNLRAISEKGEQQFNESEYKITKYSPRIVLPDDIVDEYNVTINMDRNILDEQDEGSAITRLKGIFNYKYINSTIEGNEYEEIISENKIKVSHNDNGIGDVEITVTIKAEYLENGGLLTFYTPHTTGQFVESMGIGVVIQLLRSGRQSIVPQDVVIVRSQSENIYAASSTVSIFCFAMGNPVPNVTISKVRKSGTKELKSDVIIDDKYTVLKSVTLRDTKKNGKALTGAYTCKATNGIYLKTTDTFVALHKEIEFDERKTGLTLNTTGNVVVICKASGNPRPRIEIRRGSRYGPDMMKPYGNFTSKDTSKGGTTKAVLTFSPEEEKVNVVYCVASQEVRNQFYNDMEREIRIFPERL